MYLKQFYMCIILDKIMTVLLSSLGSCHQNENMFPSFLKSFGVPCSLCVATIPLLFWFSTTTAPQSQVLSNYAWCSLTKFLGSSFDPFSVQFPVGPIFKNSYCMKKCHIAEYSLYENDINTVWFFLEA